MAQIAQMQKTEMILFVDRTQFLLIPTIGFVRDKHFCLTFAWMYYGISFPLFTLK